MFEQFRPYVRGDVVEIGAGIGTFSRLILEAGAGSLLTLEPEPACARRLDRLFADEPRARNVAERLPDAPSLTAGSADHVICQNVLEHIDDDLAATRAMAATLRPGGHLSILVPAHPRLYGRLDRRFGHCRRYTHARLASLLGDAGVDVVCLHAFNALGILGWLVQNRRRQPRISGGSLRVYEALLRGWAPIERRLNLPAGLSVIAHARRPTGPAKPVRT